MEIKYNEMVCREIVEKYLRPLLNEGKYEEMVKKWGEIVRDKIYTKNIPNITSNNSEILELEISPINTSSFIKKHLLATIPSTILIWISSLLDKDAAYIAIFMAISWIIVYALYSLFSKKTQEKIKI